MITFGAGAVVYLGCITTHKRSPLQAFLACWLSDLTFVCAGARMSAHVGPAHYSLRQDKSW